MISLSRRFLKWQSLFACGIITGVCAQTPESPTLAVRLEQIEKTYQANLQKLHAPVLLEYQRQLETLRQQFLSNSRFADLPAVDQELAQVKKLIETTGVLPYSSLLPPPPPQIPGVETPVEEIRTARQAPALVLHGEEALTSKTPSKEIPLGTADWKVATLPAGTYNVMMVFSCATLSQPENLKVSFCGQQLSASIPADRATGSPDNFQILRLGSITLFRDAKADTFSLQSENITHPQVLVRSVMFVKTKSEKN